MSQQSTKANQVLRVYILVFSIAFAVFFLGPPFLGYSFGPHILMKVADVFDLFTPLVLIPLYWLLFRLNGHKPASVKENLAFMVLAAFFVLGQAMHLTANSIGHLTDNLKGTDVYTLINFYDEVMGHYLWHFGAFGLSALLIYHQWRNPLAAGKVITWNMLLSGIIYGFTYFALVIEGATTPMGVPFALLVAIFGLIWGRRKLEQKPVLFLFLVGALTALALFLIWGIWQHGLPEFSKAGFIK